MRSAAAWLLVASFAASPAYGAATGDRAPLRKRIAANLKAVTAGSNKGVATLAHKAVLWANLGAASVFAGKIMETVATSPHPIRDGLAAGAALLAGWHLADPATAVGHWGLDNYGQDSKNPFQTSAKAFQAHHDDPSEVTRFDFAHNFAAVGKFTAPVLAYSAASALGHAAPVGDYASTLHLAGEALGLGFTGGIAMAIPSHVWSHMQPDKIPGRIVGPVVRGMQKAALFIRNRDHAHHHYDATNRKSAPFYRDRDAHNGHYAILTGLSNKVLDNPKVNLYRRMEGLLYRTTGAVPNSWRSEKGGDEMVRQALGDERAAAVIPTLRSAK
jgi:ubiquitin-conjugating enzyme E2 variant